MWVTGFKGQVVFDKIEQRLNNVLLLEWAKNPIKPYGVAEQLPIMRDMSHTIENTLRSDTKHYKMMGGHNQKAKMKEGQGQNQGQSKESGPKGKGKAKSKSGGQQKATGKPRGSKVWNDRYEHLRDIPKDILEERKKAEVCQKSGNGTHMWFECNTKAPVTSIVVAGAKRGCDKEGPKPDAKKAKTVAVKKDEIPAIVAGIHILGGIHAPKDDLDVWAL